MTLGSVQPGAEVWSVGKDGSNAIGIGLVCKQEAGQGRYILASAASNQQGPFVVCVNKAAAAADTSFSAAFPGSFVTVRADGVIEVGKEVQCATATAGEVIAFTASTVSASPTQTEVQNVRDDRLRVVGRYIGHENEITGKSPGTAAADGDLIVIRLGGN